MASNKAGGGVHHCVRRRRIFEAEDFAPLILYLYVGAGNDRDSGQLWAIAVFLIYCCGLAGSLKVAGPPSRSCAYSLAANHRSNFYGLAPEPILNSGCVHLLLLRFCSIYLTIYVS